MKSESLISLAEIANSEIEHTIHTIDLLNKQSLDLRHLNTKQSVELADKAFTLAEKSGYQKGVGDALLNKGFHAFVTSQYREAFQFYNNALGVFRKIDERNGIAHTDYNIGLIYARMGDYAAAMEFQQKSIKLRKELNDENGIASCKAQIGYLDSQFGLDDAALTEYEECLEIWRRANNKAGIGNVLMSLGVLKTKLNRLKEAKEDLLESMQIRMSINEINGVHGSVNYLSAVYLKEGNTVEALRLLKDALDTALKQEHPFIIGISRLRLSLAKVYAEMNDHENALLQLENALITAQNSGQQYQLHDIYLELSNVYKSIQQFDKALEYYEKFHENKEAIINLNASTKLKNLEMLNKVQTREKEIEIHRLKNIELEEKNRIIRKERRKSEELLLNILPRQTARELKKEGKAKPRQYKLVSVLFCDFVKFTQTAEKLSPEELVGRIDIFFRAFDEIAMKHNIEKIKTIGDAYMAAGGVPTANVTNPVQTVRAALDILRYVKEINDPLFKVRIGVHSGPVVAGIVGIKKFAYDIWGDTVNIASRMESSGESGQLNVSGFTCEFLKGQFKTSYRGKIDAKNKGMIDMYFIEELKS